MYKRQVFEIQPIPSGLPRNIEQCLNDYGIPLYLSHTITDIHGNERVTGVTVAQVDEHMKPIPGTEKEYNCDTVSYTHLNTSGNEMIYHFIDGLEDQTGVTKEELELLVNGGSVQKNINQELTYKEMYSSMDNLWSPLFMTGYLTQRGEPDLSLIHI